jgi:hypothetical protein
VCHINLYKDMELVLRKQSHQLSTRSALRAVSCPLSHELYSHRCNTCSRWTRTGSSRLVLYGVALTLMK